jgi:capsid protein
MSLASFGSLYVGSNGVSESQASAAHKLGATVAYDAIEERGRRASPAIRTQSEDRVLLPTQRAKLEANAQDIHRNFAVAQWMIRRHLDYVATFQFHGRTDCPSLSDEQNDEFNEQLEAWFTTWSQPENCDAAGRHRFSKIIRLTELLAVLRGDSGLMKLSSGKLQGIESDRIRNPIGTPYADPLWVHGVQVDAAGRAKAYAINRRLIWGGYQVERIVAADNLVLHGYFDRFDQVRGISPIASALNPLRDVYEGFDLALAKSKVEQLFALAFYRQADEAAGDTTNDSSSGDDKNAYQVDFGKGPVLLDLEPGDRAEFLQSSSPSANFQAFSQLVLTVGLKALDIPFSFSTSRTPTFSVHAEPGCTMNGPAKTSAKRWSPSKTS